MNSHQPGEVAAADGVGHRGGQFGAPKHHRRGVGDRPGAAVDGDDTVACVGEVDVDDAVMLGDPQVQAARLLLPGESFEGGQRVGEGLLRGRGLVSLEEVSGEFGAQARPAAAQGQRDMRHVGP